MISATPKIMSAVEDSCMVSPLRSSHSGRACGSGTSSAVTSQGPMGQKPGADLPLTHCPPRSFCQSRSDRSFSVQ